MIKFLVAWNLSNPDPHVPTVSFHILLVFFPKQSAMNSGSMHVFLLAKYIYSNTKFLRSKCTCSPGKRTQPLPESIVCHFCLFHCIGFCCQMYTCFSLSDLTYLLILSEKINADTAIVICAILLFYF